MSLPISLRIQNDGFPDSFMWACPKIEEVLQHHAEVLEGLRIMKPLANKGCHLAKQAIDVL